MRTRGRRRSGGKQRQSIWGASQIALDTVDSAAVTTTNIVDATDWADDGGFSRGGTFVRARGNVSGIYVPAATSSGTLWMGIALTRDSETVADPSNTNDYVEEDWLWLHCVTMGQVSLTSIGTYSSVAFNVDIDVKAKRKLTKNDIISFVMRSTGTGADESFIVSAVLRGLVMKL